MKRSRLIRFTLLLSTGLAAMLLLAACGGSESTVAQFTPSATATVPGLVKIVPKAISGSRAVVDVRIFGPEPNLDLLGSHFAIRIGDPDLVRFVPQDTYAQDALVPEAGQTIGIDVDASNRALVDVEVNKNGNGAGNGFAGASAVLIELVFDVRGSGVTTLTIVGPAGGEPVAVGSNRQPLAAVTFDAASGSLRGVTTGGGGY